MASLSGFEENIRMLHVELKEEQRKAVKELLSGKDVLAVLRTGFGKSRIYQAFTTLKNMETDGQTVVFKELKTLGYAAANLSELSTVELKECEFNILLSSAEEAMTIGFQNELKDNSTKLHERLSCIVVDESHTVETWTGKRLVLFMGIVKKLIGICCA